MNVKLLMYSCIFLQSYNFKKSLRGLSGQISELPVYICGSFEHQNPSHKCWFKAFWRPKSKSY